VHFLSPELGFSPPLGFYYVSRFPSPSWIVTDGGAHPLSCYCCWCCWCCWFTFSGDAAMVSSRCRCRNGGDGVLLQRERRGCCYGGCRCERREKMVNLLQWWWISAVVVASAAAVFRRLGCSNRCRDAIVTTWGPNANRCSNGVERKEEAAVARCFCNGC